MLFIRIFVILFLMVSGFLISIQQTILRPTPILALLGAALGLIIGVILIILESKIKQVNLAQLVWSLLGLLGGFFLAKLFSSIITSFSDLYSIRSALFLFFFIVFGYIGFLIGYYRYEAFALRGLVRIFKGNRIEKNYKILDTSVIIDGRIADICETGFIDGALIIPQFILKELQHIADSSDVLKRNRGRRGLDILQKIQKLADVQVEIIETDFPKIREVDAKLVELGKTIGGKILTNDFNLNKIAELQGVHVLNVNELANALKPVVLPGEVMNVHVLKEGKESGQGVAYLDDGTMVVVDNAIGAIGKDAEVSVTSVLQTTAGRMIFSRLKDVIPDRR